jgi:uroporphyrinogen decarboxylase
MQPMTSEALFLAACAGKETPRPPVWIMRQAGRYLPEYRAVRAKVDFLTLCKTPDLAAEVTIQPIDILGVDAAVIFSDILVLLEAMGLPVEFGPGHGPKLPKPVRSLNDIQAMTLDGISSKLEYVRRAIQTTSKALSPRNIPVLGFAGAPFTLACYSIEGETSREFAKTKRMMYEQPEAFRRLLDILADGVSLHLQSQIEAGAKAVQLFDTWGGILSQQAFREYSLPALQRCIEPLKKLKTPVILYVKGSSPHLEAMAETGADVLSVDWTLPLSEVRKRVGPNIALQGNLDPTILYSSEAEVRKQTEAMIQNHPHPGWIANLGHGLLPDLSVSNVKAFVNTVKLNKKLQLSV